MRKVFLILYISCFFNQAAFSQTIFTEATSSAGMSFENNNLLVEWTVGELMTEYYTNNSNALTQGLHQGYSGIKSNLLLENIIIYSGDNKCFPALQTIVTENMIVEQGAIVNLIAGHAIFLKGGTKVIHGGFLSAHITTNGSYCENKGTMLSVVGDNDLPAEYPETEAPSGNSSDVIVFPNPNHGRFQIKSNWKATNTEMKIEVFGIIGHKIYETTIDASEATTIDLSDAKAGLYIIKLISNNQSWSGKFIKQ